MNVQTTTARKVELKVVRGGAQEMQPKPRTLEDFLSEHRGKPNPHSEWSKRVDGQVDEVLSKKGEMDRRMKDTLSKHPHASEHQLTALVRADTRKEVLANDRAYWI